MQYVQDKTFTRENFSDNPLPQSEFEECIFKSCNFNGVDLSGFKFLNCVFTSCDLSLTTLLNTLFHNALFEECKLLGFRVDNCQDFGLSFSFKNCLLNHASFYGKKLKKIIFSHCQLHEVDFTSSDISESVFENCDLYRSIFDSTILKRVDFRSTYNYTIDPEQNTITKAKFSLPEIKGLLTKYNIDID